MPSNFWQSQLEVVDTWSPRIKRSFIGSIKTTVKNTDWQDFAGALDAGDKPGALDIILLKEYNPEPLIKKVVLKAAVASEDGISEIAKLGYRFDLINPRALKWIQFYGAREVKFVNDATTAGLKEVIFRGYFEGYTTDQQAQFIRQMVGLLPEHVIAVENYRDDLLEQGLSDVEIEKKVAKYSDKLLNYRADTIAINEASEASGQGNYFSTYDACERGVLDPGKYVEYRIITPDDRICPICTDDEHDGEERELPDGVYPSTGSRIAKVHVRCRCVGGLRKRD